jgi:hypothetical protein
MAYLEPVIGGIAAFLLGFAWYTALFGKAWQAETGITDEQAQQGMGITHGVSLLMMIILSFGINMIVNMHTPEEQTFVHGAFHGLEMAGIFALPLMVINYLYQKKSFKLMLIDGGYALAFCALSGGVMAALKLGATTA